MKKIISLIVVVQCVLLTIIGLQVYKNINYVNILYKDNTAVLMKSNTTQAADDVLLTYMNQQKEKITISKYIFIDDDNLVIYTNDFALGGKIDYQGEHPADSQFIANYNSGSEDQSGTFYIYNPGLRITIRTAEALENNGVDGLYYVNVNDVTQVIKEVNDAGGTAELYADYNVNVKTYFSDSRELLICLAMTTIILMVVVIHYIIGKTKKIAILKMHGCTRFEIKKSIIEELMLPSVCGFGTALLLVVSFGIFMYGRSSFLVIIGMFLLAFFCTSVLLWLGAMAATDLQITKGKTALMLKGKKPYRIILALHFFLKTIFLTTLLIGYISLLQQIQSLSKQQEDLKAWNQAKNVYATNLKYFGESRETEEKLATFYQNLEAEGGFIIDAQNYQLADGIYRLYEYNAPGEERYYDPYGHTVTVNENYLKVNPIAINGDYESVFDQIIHDDQVRNLLVPTNLKQYEDIINTRFLEDFYFQKVEVENIYNEKEGKAVNQLSQQELRINIIYVDEGQEYFPYMDLELAEGCSISNPIAVVETGNIDTSYYVSYLSRCFYFNKEGIDAFDYLIPFIEKAEVKSAVQNVVSVYDEYGKAIYDIEVKRNGLAITVMVVFSLFFVIAGLIITSYFEEKKYHMYVKKLFGYSLMQRTGWFIGGILVIDILVLGIAGILLQDITVLTFGSFIIIMEIITILLTGKKLDVKNFNLMIKGEH